MSTISTVGNWKKTNKKTQAIKYARMSVISFFFLSMDIIMGKQNNLGRRYTETSKNPILSAEWNYEYSIFVL